MRPFRTLFASRRLRAGIIAAAALLLLAAGCFAATFIWHRAPQQGGVFDPANTLRKESAFWQQRIKEIGPAPAYAEFLKNAPNQALSTHEQAHAFGEALYKDEGLKGLQYCDSSFAYGCYHSFLGLAVNDEGPSVLPQFAEACKQKFGTANLPCEHGIGHGILVYTNYDLLKALDLCKTISDRKTGGCSSGVFMEYNFHTMDENGDGSFVRTKTADLYAPCSTLPADYKPACYSEQPQWWESVLSEDFKKMGELCGTLSADQDSYHACYYGIGNYAAAHVENDVTKILPLCALMPEASSEAMCREGASWLVAFDPKTHESALTLCDMGEPFKSDCLRMLQ